MTAFPLSKTFQAATPVADARRRRGKRAYLSGQAAEARVALMLLKGLSHKRIARDTQTSERTVRQHSVAVYRKSGLSGRAALAGFFLESLLLPGDAHTVSPP